MLPVKPPLRQQSPLAARLSASPSVRLPPLPPCCSSGLTDWPGHPDLQSWRPYPCLKTMVAAAQVAGELKRRLVEVAVVVVVAVVKVAETEVGQRWLLEATDKTKRYTR